MSRHPPPRIAVHYARWVIRLRYPLLAVILIATVFAALAIPGIDLRNDPATLYGARLFCGQRDEVIRAGVRQGFEAPVQVA